jgi:CHAD domain-containing protein
MAPSTSVQLHLIDSAVAKRVLQRRTLLQYSVDSVQSTSTHTIYFDTHDRAVYRAQRSITLIMQAKEAQQLYWHDITDMQSPQLIESHTLHERQWPDTIHTWLATHNIPIHQLVPNAHFISKSSHRRIIDAHGHELLTATFIQGIISTHGHNEPWDTLVLTPVAHARSHEIDTILEHIYQQIPHRVDKRHLWHRIHTFLDHQPTTPTIDEAIVQHAHVLTGIQRTADEALFVPIPFHDTLPHRRLVAAIMRIHQHANTTLEPFWLALDDDTQARLRALKPHTTSTTYSALTPHIDITQIPFSEVLRLRIRIRLRSLLEREAEVVVGFRAYDVHRIRVILRKMRALLECGDGIYDAEVLSQFRRGFRRMARFLGEIRDCDALSDHILRILDLHQLPPEFDKGLASIRQKALQNFSELLTDTKHQRFLHQFAEFVTLPNSGNIITVQSLPVVLTDRINTHRMRLAQPHPKSLIKMNDDTLHDLRIQVKHLRYLLETFSDLLLPAGEVALQRLITIQDHLGTIQDAVVAQQLLTQMRLLNTPEGKRIIQTLRQEALQQRQSLPDMWNTCQDATFGESITHAIARLKS